MAFYTCLKMLFQSGGVKVLDIRQCIWLQNHSPPPPRVPVFLTLRSDSCWEVVRCDAELQVDVWVGIASVSPLSLRS